VLATLSIRDVVSATPRAKLVRVDLGSAAFDYLPGQAVLVAPHGQETRRPYSIACAPEDAKRSGAIELLVGSETTPHDDWIFVPTAGASVDVGGPVGSFTFPANPVERRFLFIAGGTGFAPLRAMLRHALGMQHDRIGLFYSARTPDEFAFEDEFRALAAAGAIDLRQTVTRDARDGWIGGRGRVTAESLAGIVDDPETLCFVCGPQALVEAVPAILQRLGVAPDRIRIEEWRSEP